MSIERDDLALVGLVAILHAWQLGMAATEVAQLRRKHKINPPVIDGPPDFTRALRAQQNCLEFGVAFQIVLWTAGVFCHQVPTFLAGLMYLFCRHLYIKGYIREADQRLFGFWWSIRSLYILILLALSGVCNVLLEKYCGIYMFSYIGDRMPVIF